MARTRKRTISEKLKEELVERAITFFDSDTESRQVEMDMRNQRYAKYRQWREGSNGEPWEDSSDVAVVDIATQVHKTQDTLYNAVISTRPIMNSKAISQKDAEKQDTIDTILDHQVFVQNDEGWLSDLIDAFTLDGHFTAFVPWVKEKRTISFGTKFPAIPDESLPSEYFNQILTAIYPEAIIGPRGSAVDSWDWIVITDEEIQISFYTDEEEEIEMIVNQEIVRFDGPKIIIKDRADVLHPAGSTNLQPPGPSNPNGASHVILVDRVSVDEVVRLQSSGRYDLLDKEFTKGTKNDQKPPITRSTMNPEEHEEQTLRNVIDGVVQNSDRPADEHELLTRLMVFDVVDLGSGVTEDVVYWVLKESKKLLRVRRLSEEFPHRMAKRPLAEEQLIAVRDRRTGIGIPELVEGLFDFKKELLDQSVDAGTLSLSPFGAYRPGSSIKEEIIRLSPGELYPMNDPQNDLFIHNFNTSGLSWAINMLALVQQDEERLTNIGDFQVGRVPPGKSSALRTASGMALLAQQGEGRPQRILRRLFNGLAQIFELIHEMNQHFLTDEMELRVATPTKPSQEAYVTINPGDLDAVVDFEFQANAFNTSKQALQEALGNIGPLVFNPLSLQAGIVSTTNLYNYSADLIKSWGQDKERYVTPPNNLPLISAEDAILSILDGRAPSGFPMEGPMQHLNELQSFIQTENVQTLDQTQVQLLQQWMQTLVQFIQQEQQQAALAQTADQGQPNEEGTNPQGSANNRSDQAPIQGEELLDESLPSAGGGGNVG